MVIVHYCVNYLISLDKRYEIFYYLLISLQFTKRNYILILIFNNHQKLAYVSKSHIKNAQMLKKKQKHFFNKTSDMDKLYRFLSSKISFKFKIPKDHFDCDLLQLVFRVTE